MATRMYLARSDAPSGTPTQDALWDFTTGFVRRHLETGKYQPDSLPPAQLTISGINTNSPAGAVDVLLAQFIGPPLDSNQTISGNIKGQVSFAESNAAADMRAQIVVWVWTGSGSRGTLYAGDAGALSSEFSVFGTVTNRKVPRGGSTALSSVNAQTGDRIVVEIGGRKHENATTSRNMTVIFGAQNGITDFSEDETDTNQNKAAWVEFSQTITFSQPTARVSQFSRRIAAAGDSNIRVSQFSRRVAIKDAVAGSSSSVIIMWHD